MTQARVLIGSRSPWGKIDYVKEIRGSDVVMVSTPTHGGVKVTGETRKQMWAQYPKAAAVGKGGWYEEDCAACIPLLLYGQDHPNYSAHRAGYTRSIINNYPDVATELGIVFDPEQSRTLRVARKQRELADHFVASSAWGDWCTGARNSSPNRVDVPAGWVGVVVVPMGKRIITDPNDRPAELWLLVRKLRYDQKDPDLGTVFTPDEIVNISADVIPWPAAG